MSVNHFLKGYTQNETKERSKRPDSSDTRFIRPLTYHNCAAVTYKQTRDLNQV